MQRDEVEVFLTAHSVRKTEEGEVLLTLNDALTLLTRLTESGGPFPAYVDVYLQDMRGGLQFEEDLTLRDIHVLDLGREQYRSNIVAYLSGCGSDHLVCLNEFVQL